MLLKNGRRIHDKLLLQKLKREKAWWGLWTNIILMANL